MFYYALEMQPVQTVSVKDTLVFEDLVGKKSSKKNSVVILIKYRNIWNMLGEMGFLVAQMVKNLPIQLARDCGSLSNPFLKWLCMFHFSLTLIGENSQD